MVSIGPKNNFLKPAVAKKPPVAPEPPAAPTSGPQKAKKSYNCGTTGSSETVGKNIYINTSTWKMY